MASQETGQITGTKDKDYNIIWFTEQCLSNVLRLETYVQDAERDGDNELAEFFRRARARAARAPSRARRCCAAVWPADRSSTTHPPRRAAARPGRAGRSPYSLARQRSAKATPPASSTSPAPAKPAVTSRFSGRVPTCVPTRS